MFKTFFAVSTAVVLLSGCTAQQYAKKQYFDQADGVAYHDKASNQDFEMYDKPSDGKVMMIMAVGGSVSMILFGTSVVPPQQVYETAAQAWLDQGTRGCKVDRSTATMAGAYEVSYTCQPGSRVQQPAGNSKNPTGM